MSATGYRIMNIETMVLTREEATQRRPVWKVFLHNTDDVIIFCAWGEDDGCVISSFEYVLGVCMGSGYTRNRLEPTLTGRVRVARIENRREEKIYRFQQGTQNLWYNTGSGLEERWARGDTGCCGSLASHHRLVKATGVVVTSH
ncbi:hypothetical protein CRG98_043586 [Punica granatum]|uniref:Uncharacterized protein n=1 Tax=Punica granatum TaxID=22663 RepID=A0A2I0HWD9_PUNGR|nr:hypothetical protein CRG98_043586 [Punica granatum]